MHKNSVEYLKHILDECNFIVSKITPDFDRSIFLNDETLKRAVVRSLEIIGEASKKIPADVKYRWSTIKNGKIWPGCETNSYMITWE